MPFHITCVCGRMTVVPEEQAGQVIACPDCDRPLHVTVDDWAVPPPAPTPPPIPPTAPSGAEPSVQVAIRSPRLASPDGHRQAARRLALALVLVAVVSSVPILLAVTGSRQHGDWQPERWAIVLVWVALLQCAYAVFLAQVPDWSSVWVVFLWSLAIAAGYAAAMGLCLLASPENPALGVLQLSTARFTAGQRAGWCLIMLLLYLPLSFWAGRIRTDWQRHFD